MQCVTYRIPIVTCLGECGLYLQKHPPEKFYKKDVLRNFENFTGKHMYQSLFFNEVAGQPAIRP